MNIKILVILLMLFPISVSAWTETEWCNAFAKMASTMIDAKNSGMTKSHAYEILNKQYSGNQLTTLKGLVDDIYDNEFIGTQREIYDYCMFVK